MDIPLEAHLLQLCNAVGGYEIDVESSTEIYTLGDEALGTLIETTFKLRMFKGHQTTTSFGRQDT
jgi:hypothetical protein